ncbi:hypothetical protein [Natronomonas sp. LN261]|jgi:hypothetical protein|uniref:DUF7096 domain-containing protein n=1 Tax=Natronomonas sp. LN261 TaxID=2750669 RepID=UPI0015EE6CAA|nr:hypothetical protein [Natronomonas sp. LN261]
MDGTRALVAALLLCVAPIGGIAVAESPGDSSGVGVGGSPGAVAEPQRTTEDADGSMSILTVENTSEYLAPPPDGVDRTGSGTTGINVAAAVEADAGGLESAYVASTLERRYANADTTAERRAVVEDSADRLTRRVDELRTRERTAIRQYNEGTIETHELVRRLTVVSRAAEVTAGSLEWLETTANDLGMDGQAERAATGRVRLLPFGGPVRSELAGVVAGDGSLHVYAETAGDGVVLAAVDPADDTYLREAYDPSARDSGTPDQYGGSPLFALEQMERLYPWVTENDLGISASPIGPVFDRVYRFSIPHPHGELETYLDSGSEAVTVEFQRNDVDALPTETRRNTENDLRLVANATRGGGPVEIAVLDATTGEPVDADLQLNGDPVGSTGGDRLWTVAPRGPVSVNATHADETVSLEMP